MTAEDRPARTRVGMISLGCAKNLVDSEVILGHLDRAGCELVTVAANVAKLCDSVAWSNVWDRFAPIVAEVLVPSL